MHKTHLAARHSNIFVTASTRSAFSFANRREANQSRTHVYFSTITFHLAYFCAPSPHAVQHLFTRQLNLFIFNQFISIQNPYEYLNWPQQIPTFTNLLIITWSTPKTWSRWEGVPSNGSSNQQKTSQSVNIESSTLHISQFHATYISTDNLKFDHFVILTPQRATDEQLAQFQWHIYNEFVIFMKQNTNTPR